MYVFSYLRKFHQKRALKNKSMVVLDGIMKPFWLRTGELGLAPHPSPQLGSPAIPPAGWWWHPGPDPPKQTREVSRRSLPASPGKPQPRTATSGHENDCHQELLQGMWSGTDGAGTGSSALAPSQLGWVTGAGGSTSEADPGELSRR